MRSERIERAFRELLGHPERYPDRPGAGVIARAWPHAPASKVPRLRGYNTICMLINPEVATPPGPVAARLVGKGELLGCALLVRWDRIDSQLYPTVPADSGLFRLLTSLAGTRDETSHGSVRQLPDPDSEKVADLLTLAVVTYVERPSDWESELEALAMALVVATTRGMEAGHAAPSADTAVALALREIASHPESVTLGELAGRLSYNPTYLSELLRKKTGRAYSDLVLEQRMDRAAFLLRTTDLPVRAVARMVGYASTSNFYEKFEARFGHGPAALRTP